MINVVKANANVRDNVNAGQIVKEVVINKMTSKN